MQNISMLERKITKQIQDWYENSSSALLIDGASQIGKTTVIEQFLKDNKIDYLELNLIENKLALEAFNTASNVKQLLFRISSLSSKELVENKTVI